MKIKKEYFEPAIWIAGLLAIWELISRSGIVSAFLMPPPSVIITEMLTTKAVWIHFDTTLYEVLIGFSSAAVIGIALATIIATSKHLERGMYPIIVFFQSVPKSALCPLFIAWFGFGFLPKAMVAFLITFFPILINTITGLTIIEPEMLDMMSSLRASKWQVFRKIRLPKSLPYMFSGFKISAPLSVIGAIVAEFIAGDAGLGYLVQVAVYQVNMPLLFSSLAGMAIMGVALFAIATISEKFLLPWYKR